MLWTKMKIWSLPSLIWLILALNTRISEQSAHNVQCGGDLSARQGGFQSPKYPDNYPNDAECKWTISAPPGQQISLHFVDLMIENTDHCGSDYVKIFDGPNDEADIIGKYCGSEKPEAITSSSNNLHVRFKSDFSLGYRGFLATYNASALCGGTFRKMQDVLYSPNHPNNYDDLSNCVYTIIVPAGHRIRLDFIRFDVEMGETGGLGGCLDYVDLFDGATDSSPMIGRFCGSSPPKTQWSSGNAMRLRFVSDNTVKKTGFTVKYAAQVPVTRPPTLATTFRRTRHPTDAPELFTCSPLHFQCKSGQCIDRLWRCDRQDDCYDGSDEEDCGCRPYEFSCQNGNCVDTRWKCDGADDCGDDSDESDCKEDSLVTATPPACPPFEFTCGDGQCIPYEQKCDAITQCADASDEDECNCFPHEFKCQNGICVDSRWLCDGKDDCGDASDEMSCNGDPCSFNKGGCDHVCDNSTKVRVCSCNPGFELMPDRKSCLDLDECNSNPCGQQCINTPGSYKCECKNGFFLTVNKRSCEDVNECSVFNGGCTHECLNTRGSFLCLCPPGFWLDNDRRTCRDKDECLDANGGCSHQCVNTPGSYHCRCRVGFLLGDNNRTCQDIDECAEKNGGCVQGCENNPGGYECWCREGYMQDHRNLINCLDIDECLEGVPNCPTCINTEGGYKCECDDGFLPNTNKTECLDIDECAVNNGGCSQTCVNVKSSYLCACQDGYEPAGESSHECLDVDECEKNSGRGNCDQLCLNTQGSYICSCDDGYRLDGVKCLDINECDVPNLHSCEHYCNNTDGSFLCYCQDGFYLGPDGKSCSQTEDISSCGIARARLPVTQGWHEAAYGTWPWQVVLRMRLGTLESEVSGCMGTLLSNEWIITTSHCGHLGSVQFTPDILQVELGRHWRSEKTQDVLRVNVRKVVSHPEFNSDLNKLMSNIALIQLAQPVNFTNSIHPICLPAKSEIQRFLHTAKKNKGVVISWGKLPDNSISDALRQSEVIITHRKHCDWAQRYYHQRKMLCAGFDEESAQQCLGDSGSPLMFSIPHPQKTTRWYLGGLISWGANTFPEGCSPNFRYTAYVNVAKYLKWINDNVRPYSDA